MGAFLGEAAGREWINLVIVADSEAAIRWM